MNDENHPGRHSSTEETGDLTGSELQEYLEVRDQRRWIFPKSALVGALAGLVTLLFRGALAGADALRNGLLAWAHNFPAVGWIFPVLVALAGAAISVAITRRYAPEAAGSGIPHLEAVLHRVRSLDWKRILPVKFLGGTLAIGSGLALGREGPSVQMGGAVGDAVARWLKVSPRQRLTLISAGAGAGLAAAFNAPFAGLVFVLEEVRRDFQPIVFGAAFVAAVLADIVARIGSDQLPIFAVPSYPTPPLASLPIFAILGVVLGALGVAFNRGLLAATALYARLTGRWVIPAAAVTGGLIGLVGWFSPSLVSSGHILAESALKGDLLLAAIPLFFILRFLMTAASYATGAPGGIFSPLLVLGALVGLGIGQLANMAAPDVVPYSGRFCRGGHGRLFYCYRARPADRDHAHPGNDRQLFADAALAGELLLRLRRGRAVERPADL